ncbi:MAG: HD-GYP domain-containing protein [Thermodesulfobacteriota bacterium]
MIKKVKTEQLRPGVFVHEVECDEAGGNTFVNGTMLISQKAIDIISSWGIKEVYIDTERGLDIKGSKDSPEENKKSAASSVPMAEEGLSRPPHIPLKEEVKVAQSIKREAVELMQHSMANILEGRDVDIDGAYQLVEKMQESVTRNRDALTLLTRIRNKDEYTMMHSISVSSLVLAFCSSYLIPHDTTIQLGLGALLHDIGKTRVPSSILNKPGKLSSEEFRIMKEHAEHSAEILAEASELPPEVFDIALHHHERYDGSGYPHALPGEKIGFGAKLTAICDVYDAITSDRVYRKGMERVAGLSKLYEWSSSHFDQDLTYKFIKYIGVYPVGTCVKLENQLSAMVTDSTDNVLQPVVRIFYDNNTNSRASVEEINLSMVGINVTGYESPMEWDSDKMNCFRDIKRSLNPLM